MKIKEYRILSDANENDLTKLVNAFIDEGWQPYGSLCVMGDANEHIYMHTQAMVKYEEI